MTWFDIAVLIVLGLSVLLGILRGFVKEVMALVSWIIAFILARQFANTAAQFLPAAIPTDGLRYAAGFLIVLFGSLLILWLLTYFISQILKATGLSVVNRTIGAIFGFVRGGVIVLIGVLVAGLTELPKDPGWRNAWFSAPFQAVAVSVKAWLPESIKTRIKYD